MQHFLYSHSVFKCHIIFWDGKSFFFAAAQFSAWMKMDSLFIVQKLLEKCYWWMKQSNHGMSFLIYTFTYMSTMMMKSVERKSGKKNSECIWQWAIKRKKIKNKNICIKVNFILLFSPSFSLGFFGQLPTHTSLAKHHWSTHFFVPF